MARRALVPFLAALAALLLVPPALAGPSSHPYFNDGGTLTWYRSYDRARDAARAEGKVVFIEFGRRICGSCKRLCATVLPDPRVKGRLSRAAVGLAAECDRPDPRVRALFDRHVRAHILPFVAFVTPDGQFISGFGGMTTADTFLSHLAKAEAHVARTPRAPRLVQAPRQPQPVTPQQPVASPQQRRRVMPPARPHVAKAPTSRPVVRPAPRPLPCPPPTPCPCPPQTAQGGCRDCETEPSVMPAPVLADQPTPLLRRTPRTFRAPAPELLGDPDGRPSETLALVPPTRRMPAPAPTLTPPTVKILPPVRVEARTRRAARRATAHRDPAGRGPADLASKGKWGEVLKLCHASPNDDALRRYSIRAHTWADERLEAAVEGAERAEFESSLRAIEEVLGQMAGEPEYVDAARGLQAIKTLLELRFLNTEGEVARSLRHQAHEDLRGTRWSRLFADA